MALAEVRETRGLTAAGLARQLSIPLEELLAVERGEKTPRLCEAQKWANALGLTFEEFGYHFYELADPVE
ncbi:MAG TPA: helix-turn-helix transcriptional regulator [Spirochaetia bacterium]|nr:helix-turn-helix transcriptional regulator [Spirochaetia bacterium]